uniref:NADH-ubiquinone oxidoreductase chain 4L n=1 Tax=Ixodes nipponensis TaxID=63660 RepID=A0A8E5NIL9_9ACAR|nr:NADH dehydrogenase subunit 4L [Ixodes nipponensis]YP_010324829.1 NADH dehydrogenase subunit 4L [Ixodes sinensis]QVD40447.1 NADH dehydrogenase subunit 4L [Ixodes nipponensis]UNO53607.1 NADH dehydrogenase subunit 4L [Ixodes sinensis]UNO53685.1 NADH dehydrogenase subunit 4L [Ixodes sinensis]UNO53711.1 NADH dehydrogenase subunit 4L [Ixodes sinensis]
MMELAIFMYLVGLTSFLKNRFYLMMILLSFEFMYLSLFMLINCMILMDTYLLVLVYLTMIVAEASLGLSLMVIMSFFYGNDQVSSLYMLKC